MFFNASFSTRSVHRRVKVIRCLLPSATLRYTQVHSLGKPRSECVCWRGSSFAMLRHCLCLLRRHSGVQCTPETREIFFLGNCLSVSLFLLSLSFSLTPSLPYLSLFLLIVYMSLYTLSPLPGLLFHSPLPSLSLPLSLSPSSPPVLLKNPLIG